MYESTKGRSPRKEIAQGRIGTKLIEVTPSENIYMIHLSCYSIPL